MLTKLQMDTDQGIGDRVNYQTWAQAKGQVGNKIRVLISEKTGVWLNERVNLGVCQQVLWSLQRGPS